MHADWARKQDGSGGPCGRIATERIALRANNHVDVVPERDQRFAPMGLFIGEASMPKPPSSTQAEADSWAPKETT